MTKPSFSLILPLFVTLVVGCRGDSVGPKPVDQGRVLTTLEVSPSITTIFPENTAQLTISAWDQFRVPILETFPGEWAASGKATYVSSAPLIATVNDSGLVMGVSPGTAEITATLTLAGVTRTASVTETVLNKPPPDLSVPLQIYADIADGLQLVLVTRAGGGINYAMVTVNGSALALDTGSGCVAGPCIGSYRGRLSLAAGSQVALEVKADGLTIEATGKVPEAPVLTAPATGTVFSLADSITLTWTTATSPDRFELGFGTGCWGYGYSFEDSLSAAPVHFDPIRASPAAASMSAVDLCWVFEAPGSARELKVAASQMGASFGTDYVQVFAINEGSFTGPADPESHMSIQYPNEFMSLITKITILP